jgi:hypothetical protein
MTTKTKKRFSPFSIFKFKRKSTSKTTNFCDKSNNKKVKEISKKILFGKENEYNEVGEETKFYKDYLIFYKNVNEELYTKNMTDFINYDKLVKDLYEKNKIILNLDKAYEAYRSNKKILKPTFLSLMTKYSEVDILCTIAYIAYDYLINNYKHKKGAFQNIQKNILTHRNDEVDSILLSRKLDKTTADFGELKIIDCKSYEVYRNNFTNLLVRIINMYNRIEPNKLYIPENQRYYKPSPFTYNLFPSLTKKGSLKLTKQSQTNNGKNVFFIKENTSLNLQHVKPFNFESNSLNSKSNSPNTAINSPSNSLNSKSNFLKLSKSKETIV